MKKWGKNGRWGRNYVVVVVVKASSVEKEEQRTNKGKVATCVQESLASEN